MNTNLVKYLSGVLRNEVQNKTVPESKGCEPSMPNLNDSRVNQFLLDGKYALHLDEII
jgi:hypothetical protein